MSLSVGGSFLISRGVGLQGQNVADEARGGVLKVCMRPKRFGFGGSSEARESFRQVQLRRDHLGQYLNHLKVVYDDGEAL